jgi:tetratricopeptide (TPR) repeat protein
MSLKPPSDRRKFANAWDEIEYLRDKLLFWLYQRGDKEKARSYADRLEKLLPQADAGHEAILGEECRSLVYETKGDLAKAIQHRERQIGLIRRLQELAEKQPHRDSMLRGYGQEDLSDRLDLLAALYHESGNLDKAIAALRESERICRRHRLLFAGADMLRDYLKEKRRMPDGVAYKVNGPGLPAVSRRG